MWILFIMQVYSHSISQYSMEFSSKESCEIAKSKIYEKYTTDMYWPYRDDSNHYVECFQK